MFRVRIAHNSAAVVSELPQKRWLVRWTLAVAGLVTIFFMALGCGSDAGTSTGGPFQKVSPSDRTYSGDDFLAIGFRKLKEYDVEGLPSATGAWFGFWRPDGQRPRNYELRFYASHEDAVQHGAQLAEEVTGTAAVLITDDMTWKEGARDRRVQSGRIGQLVPVYGDYAIIGNVAMLCEGLDSTQSLERCAVLIGALAPVDSR